MKNVSMNIFKKWNIEYYYIKKMAVANYSNNPSGIFNVQKALNNQPPFQSTKIIERKEKQNIVFHNFFAQYWDGQIEWQVTQFIEQLLDEEYPVYVFSNNALIKISNTKKLLQLLKENNSPVAEGSLISAAAEKKISKAALKIINHHELNKLMDERVYEETAIFTRNYWHKQENQAYAQLLSQLQQLNPRITSVICHTFPDDINMAKKIAEKLQISIAWDFCSLNLPPHLLNTLAKTNRITENEIIFNEKHFAGITSFTLISKKNTKPELPENFSDLLEKFTALQHLNLKKATGTTRLASNQANYSFETLILSGSDINHQSLTFLLKNSPKLAHLGLEKCPNIDWTQMDYQLFKDIKSINLDSKANVALLLDSAEQLQSLNIDILPSNPLEIKNKLTLKNIKHIGLFGSNVSGENLSHLLFNAEKLMSLNILDITINGEMTEKISCPLLQDFSFHHQKISIENFFVLLEGMPNIKTIDFTPFHEITSNIWNNFSWEKLSLLALEEISFRNTSITANALNQFWPKAPKLKKIKLNFCKNIDWKKINLETVSLGELEEISFSTSITANALNQFWPKAPKLKNIVLNFCKNIDWKKINLETVSLGELEEISFSDTSIIAEVLNQFLQKAPKLKNIVLNFCENIDWKKINLETLPALEEISFSGTSIIAEVLNQLLQKALKLKGIDLSDCQDILWDRINWRTLPALEWISFGGTSITANALNQFWPKALKLKNLILSDCKNILWDQINWETLPALEWISFSTSITANALNQFWPKAPKLKTIRLFHCKNILWDKINWETFSLAVLEELFLMDTIITEKALLILLENAKNLISVNFLRVNIILLNGNKPSNKLDIFLKKFNINVNKKNFINSSPTDTLPTNTLPTDTLPTDTLPTDTLPTDTLPTDTLPTDTLPTDTLPTDTLPTDTLPTDTLPTDTSMICHADTTFNPKTTVCKKKIFSSLNDSVEDPNPGVYRLQLFDTLSIEKNTCTIYNPFCLTNTYDPNDIKEKTFSRLNSIPTKITINTASTHSFLGIQKMTLSNNWLPLASLSPNDILDGIYTEPENTQIKIGYSKQDNRYYIKGETQEQTARVYFVLKQAVQPTEKLPDNIQSLCEELQNYGNNTLEGIKNDWNGTDFINAMINQKTGSCVHRAIIFKWKMLKIAPNILVRIITNDSHMFVEIFINGQWIRIDLGGYPVNENIIDPFKPNLESEMLCKNPENNQLNKEFNLSAKDTNFEKAVPQSSLEQQAIFSPFCQFSAGAADNDEKYFISHAKKTTQIESLRDYCSKKLCADEKTKVLIELSSAEALHGLQYALQEHCLKIHRPVFYIYSPDDLICQAHVIKLKNLTTLEGECQKGPGGALYDFLHKQIYHKENPPILIINYDNFAADDIVRFNALLDEERYADGVVIPKITKIIGLINTQKPNRYTGADFYSRFEGNVETCPVHFSELKQKLCIPYEKNNTQITEDAVIIRLYNEKEGWKSQLIGTWNLNGDRLSYSEGLLPLALQSGKQIVLENAPTDIPEFEHFLTQAFLEKRIRYPLGELDLSHAKPFLLKQGYDWHTLSDNLKYDTTFFKDGIICNPQKKFDLFHRYTCENKKLLSLTGYLENHKGQTLHLNISRELSEHVWAEILQSAKQLQIQLQLHFQRIEVIPTFLQKENTLSTFPLEMTGVKTPSLPKPSIVSSTQTEIVVSNDFDASIAMFTHTAPNKWIVLDISECQTSDLLMSLKGNFDAENGTFSFFEQTAPLLQALNEGKSLILTGTLSPQLADELSALIWQRMQSQTTGQLVILTDNRNTFAFMPQSEHKVSAEEKKQLLKLKDEEISRIGGNAAIETTAFVILQTRLNFIRNNPSESYQKAWQGMENLPSKIYLSPFNPEKSMQEAKNFHAQRLVAVEKMLSDAPFVFLTGLTGVGKTTFVMEYLAKKYRIYYGENALEKWANDTSKQSKILFFDEANLDICQWSQFEGLSHDPRTLLFNGKLITLSENHKIVFAGNPVSYGDDRSLASLFARHGNAVLFEPLPLNNIYEDILKPVFAEGLEEKEILKLCYPILTVYQFLCEQSQDEISISPRELQMMVLLLVAGKQNNLSLERAEHLAREIARQALPDTLKAEFDNTFPEKIQSIIPPSQTKGGFLITPSRQALLDLLEDMLALRLRRRRSNEKMNDAQRYGGLGGLIVEGEPGIGKSEIIKKCLIAEGYQRGDFNHANSTDTEKCYYEIPVSMGITEKINVLLKAFHEGAIVLIDEINSAPMMEKVLNTLLMGRDLEGNRPKNLGFTLIGTQNPISMDGRIPQSNALARRTINCKLPNYTNQELECIILFTYPNITPEKAKKMVADYVNHLNHAKQQHLSPLPCVRDLFNLAKNEDQRAQKIIEYNTPITTVIPEEERNITLNLGQPEKPLSQTNLKKQSSFDASPVGLDVKKYAGPNDQIIFENDKNTAFSENFSIKENFHDSSKNMINNVVSKNEEMPEPADTNTLYTQSTKSIFSDPQANTRMNCKFNQNNTLMKFFDLIQAIDVLNLHTINIFFSPHHFTDVAPKKQTPN